MFLSNPCFFWFADRDYNEMTSKVSVNDLSGVSVFKYLATYLEQSFRVFYYFFFFFLSRLLRPIPFPLAKVTFAFTAVFHKFLNIKHTGCDTLFSSFFQLCL